MQTSFSNLRTPGGMPTLFTMDTPYRRGSAGETPITRMLGHAISNPGLAAIKPTDTASPVMTRASNVANLTAAMLLNLQPAEREAALIKVAGLNFTQQILGFARNYPGALGITDAIRFSLALHFLMGILDSEAGRQSTYADGYLAFARLFKDVQSRRSGRYTGFTGAESNARVNGLGSLGNHPILAGEDWTKGNETQAEATARARARAALWDQWCRDNAGVTFNPAKLNACLNPGLSCDTQHPSSTEGRRCRGLADGWTPPRTQATYPAPPDTPMTDVQLVAEMQLGNCGTDKPIDKLLGIRIAFKEVFGRFPNSAEAVFYGHMRWCINGRGVGQAMRDKMVAVRQGIERGELSVTTPAPSDIGPVFPYDMEKRTVFTDVGEGLQKAAEAAFDFLGKTNDFIADIMCKGFKALFDPAIGGVMCDIITFLTRMMTAGVAAIIDIVIESLKGTFEFIKLMIQGKIEQALLALLQTMGRTLFSLSAPLMVPILMADKGQGRSMSQAFAELKVRADRVVKKQPLWPIMVIMAVVGVVTGGISGSILAPPFTALTQLIIALAPMAATFISEPMKRGIVELRDETLEVIEAGIEKFIKFVLLLVTGAIAIKEMVSKLRGQLAAYFKKASPASLTGGTKAGGAERVKYVLEKFSAGINVVVNAFKSFNIKDMTATVGPLLMLIPDLLLAILPDDAAEAMPSLTEWKDAVKKNTATVDEAERTLQAGAADIFKTFTLDTKVSFLKTEVKAMAATASPDAVRAAHAATAATIIGEQFKNKASYPKFVAQFRQELLKV